MCRQDQPVDLGLDTLAEGRGAGVDIELVLADSEMPGGNRLGDIEQLDGVQQTTARHVAVEKGKGRTLGGDDPRGVTKALSHGN